ARERRARDDQIPGAPVPQGVELGHEGQVGRTVDRNVLARAVLREVPGAPAKVEPLVGAAADDEDPGLGLEQAVEELSNRGDELRRALRLREHRRRLAGERWRCRDRGPERRLVQVVDQAAVRTIGDQPVARLQVLCELRIVVEPPGVRTREDQVVGARGPELLEMGDRGNGVGGVIAAVLACGRAGEVPTEPVLELDELLVTLADDENRRSGRDQFPDDLVDSPAKLQVLLLAHRGLGRARLRRYVEPAELTGSGAHDGAFTWTGAGTGSIGLPTRS